MIEYFFSQVGLSEKTKEFLADLKTYAESIEKTVYVLDCPLTDRKYSYAFHDALIVMSSNKKLAFVNFGNNDDFNDYYHEVIEDLYSLSDRYNYKDVIGRPKKWAPECICKYDAKDINDLAEWFDNKISLPVDAKPRLVDLLISLMIGSINDVSGISIETPQNLIDRVRQKIQLFDSQQTRFIYEELNTGNKRVTIQGLSGTGKTELLLHKLKDLYIQVPDSKLCFTCHNKVLASVMAKRVPNFFTSMKVDQQIDPDRLLCVNAWGKLSDEYSGAYRYICNFYDINFYSYSQVLDFSEACRRASISIEEKQKTGQIQYAFTYMFIDESQDFTEEFFHLCELVTERKVFIAGDVFQSIFERVEKGTQPDFMLSNCYRTDPRTLMIAHSLGMGLFEGKKLWWLEKREWEYYGYNVEEKNNQYILTRHPVRRFEDIDDDFKCFVFARCSNVVSEIIYEIKRLKEEFPTLQPDDICIIFPDNSKYIYDIVPAIQVKISEEINWRVNIAYETKKQISNTVFVTNRNNVKGLEYPFVFCFTKCILAEEDYRNSLYTMLTRSFIRSYLLVMDDEYNGVTEDIVNGANLVMKENKIVVDIPSEQEQKDIRINLKLSKKSMSLMEKIQEACLELNIAEPVIHKLQEILKDINNDISTEELKFLIKTLSKNV